MREREKRALDDLTKLMINGDTQHASQSNDVFHFLVFSFSVLDNVLYNRCYGYSIVCQKQKPNAHFFFLPNCVLPRCLDASHRNCGSHGTSGHFSYKRRDQCSQAT